MAYREEHLFGETFAQAESLGLSSITGTTTFQQKLRLTFTAVAGTYLIFGKFSWRYSSVSAAEFKAMIETDDSFSGFTFQLEPQDAGAEQDDSVCTFYIQNLTAGSHNIDMDYGTSSVSETAYIQKARLAVWRVA